MRILGIDPGSRVTGYGLILLQRGRLQHLQSGTVRPPPRDDGNRRIAYIHAQLARFVAEQRPDEIAIERVFMNRNPGSTILLGQARGAAIIAALSHCSALFEYAPSEVKQVTVGNGRADKQQVQFMVRVLLRLDKTYALSPDAADALAVAICHTQYRHGRCPPTAKAKRGLRR